MSEQTVQCPHDGNPDFYGLGIRVGIYLQLTTAILAKYFRPEAIPENLTANTIFLLALFAAIAMATLGSGLRPEEIAILLQLCFGFLLSVLSILGGRPGPDHPKGHATIPAPPSIASYLRLALTMAISAYAVWFWFPGKNEMEISGCASYMFFSDKSERLRWCPSLLPSPISHHHHSTWCLVYLVFNSPLLVLRFDIGCIINLRSQARPQRLTNWRWVANYHPSTKNRAHCVVEERSWIKLGRIHTLRQNILDAPTRR